MSALTDYFSSMATKIRSKTGKSALLTPAQMIPEIDAVYEAGQESGGGGGGGSGVSLATTRMYPSKFWVDYTWSPKIWTGLTEFNGVQVWTDGDNIYYSSGSAQYVLDKSTSTWSPKTWTGLTEFYGSNVWMDGDNIYYSSGSAQYVLDKSTSTWSPKTWTGLTEFNGYDVWTDGDNIYYSYNTTQKVLNKSTSTWTNKTWTGLTNFKGEDIIVYYENGYTIRYSPGSAYYIKSGDSWTQGTWPYDYVITGKHVWSDGNRMFCDNQNSHYYKSSTQNYWTTMTWNISNFMGSNVWTDGDNIYISQGTSQYVLENKLHVH